MRSVTFSVLAASSIALAVGSGSASTFNVLNQFEGGIGGYTTPQPVPLFSSGAPADISGAVGMNGTSEVVTELLNGYYGVYTSAGVPITQETAGVFWANALGATALSAAIGGGTLTINSPQIVYDPTSQRWFASSELSGNSDTFLVAASDTSNPGGVWSGFAIPSGGGSTTNLDTLAVNGQNVYLNGQSNGGFTGQAAVFVAIPKAAMTAAVPSVNGYRINTVSAGGGYIVQPVQETGSSSSTEYYYSGDNPNQLSRSEMTGTSLYNYALSQGVGSAVNFTSAAAVSATAAIGQPGTTATISAPSSSLSSNLYMVNGLVWGTQVVENAAFPTLNAIRYFVINPKTNKFVTQGIISDTTGNISYTNPSIAVSSSGNLVIDFSGGGTTSNLATYVVTGSFNGSDLKLSLSAPQVLLAATGPYKQAGSSWAQNSSIVADPTNPNDFWIFQELPDGTNPNQWDTWITQIDPPVPGSVVAVPEPGVLPILFLGASPLLLTLRRRKVGS